MIRGIATFATILATFWVLFEHPPLSAQNNPYVSWGQGLISELRSEMHESMSADDVRLDQSIRYRVVDSGVLNAAALKQGDRREIRITAAVLATIDNVATMNTISFLWDKLQCLNEYDDYIADLYDSNSIAVSDGLEPKGMEPPFIFIRHHADVCPQLSPNVITNNERDAGGMRTVLIRKSIEWVLLHEFAHHLYDDFNSVSMSASRERESRADKYAFRTMLVSANDNPMVAAPIILVFCAIENFNSDDSRSDHPAGVRRLKAMIDSARDSEQWKKMWSLASPSQRQTIQIMLDQLNQME